MKKTFMIIGAIVVGLIVLGIIIFAVTSFTSEKLICESEEGNITIMYNDETLTGYTSNGITYDFDGQKEVADQQGVDAYIIDFEIWFLENTSGTCEMK